MKILLAVTFALWGAGWIVLGLVRRPGREKTNQTVSDQRLSIIIPARNEEQNLPMVLRSIGGQTSRPFEIIVVNDASTDRTAEVASEFGARVIDSQTLPEGWRGKTWACHQGAQAAAGELFLFLDADTRFEPGGLARVLANYDGGAFSVGPFHAVRCAYENLSLFFNVNMIVGTSRTGLFGQMLLVGRESFRHVGGYEAVKGRVLENCFLAQRFRAAGIPCLSVTGRGILSFRMYPNGLRELIDGWTKGFTSGAGQTPRHLLLLVVAWKISLMLAPIGWLIAGNPWSWGTMYILCAVQVSWVSRQIGAFRWWTALFYPVPLVFFFVVFARSLLRTGKQVTWKGRTFHAG